MPTCVGMTLGAARALPAQPLGLAWSVAA